MAGATGLEPATFGVTGRLFIQQNQGLFRLFGCQSGPKTGTCRNTFWVSMIGRKDRWKGRSTGSRPKSTTASSLAVILLAVGYRLAASARPYRVALDAVDRDPWPSHPFGGLVSREAHGCRELAVRGWIAKHPPDFARHCVARSRAVSRTKVLNLSFGLPLAGSLRLSEASMKASISARIFSRFEILLRTARRASSAIR